MRNIKIFKYDDLNRSDHPNVGRVFPSQRHNADEDEILSDIIPDKDTKTTEPTSGREGPLQKLLKSEEEKPHTINDKTKTIAKSANAKPMLETKSDSLNNQRDLTDSKKVTGHKKDKNEKSVEPQRYSLRPRISKPQVYLLKITENS